MAGVLNAIRADARQLPLRSAIDGAGRVRDDAVRLVVTSPPYLRQRAYGRDHREIGLEDSLKRYVAMIADVFDELRRVMAPDAVAFLNIGDKSNGSGGAGGDWTPERRRRAPGGGPIKFLDPDYLAQSFLDVPGAVVRELLHRRWRLRAPIVWDKSQQAPESLDHVLRPRPQHEMIFMLAPTKLRSRFFPHDMAEMGSIWRFPAGGSGPPHLAPFPDELAKRCILPGSREGDIVFDPFAGSGTVARVATALGRVGIGTDLYAEQLSEADDGI